MEEQFHAKLASDGIQSEYARENGEKADTQFPGRETLALDDTMLHSIRRFRVAPHEM